MLRFLGGEVVGGEQDAFLQEWIVAFFGVCVKGQLAVYHEQRYGELLFDDLLPLMQQRRRHDDEDVLLAFVPHLRDDQHGLVGFAERAFITEDRALQVWGPQGKQRRRDLVRVDFNNGGGEHRQELALAEGVAGQLPHFIECVEW